MSRRRRGLAALAATSLIAGGAALLPAGAAGSAHHHCPKHRVWNAKRHACVHKGKTGGSTGIGPPQTY